MSEAIHGKVVATVADRVRKHRATAALVVARVSGPGEPEPDGLPCVVVAAGRDYGTGSGGIAQGNVSIECRSADEAGLHDLLTAVHVALSRWREPPVRDVVCLHTGDESDEANHWARRDEFAVFYSDRKAAH